jgi:transcriptional regulator GlxA family with amidase domain
MLIQIVLFEGFDELDAIAPFEVLSMASKRLTGWRIEFVTTDCAASVRAANGLVVQLDGARLDAANRPDVLLVPGGGWADRTPQGARAEVERGAIPAAIADCHQAGSVIASVCTGAMLVAAAGLLKGRPAVTHHLAENDLRAAGAEVVSARVVDDGSIVSAGGITSGLDLALWLVERFGGADLAREIETRLEYERRGTVWRSETQADRS